jgi:hypothetical protein
LTIAKYQLQITAIHRPSIQNQIESGSHIGKRLKPLTDGRSPIAVVRAVHKTFNPEEARHD